MRVGIVGTGYVGLTTGVVFARQGHRVVCADRDPEKVAMLSRGRVPFYEPRLQPLLRHMIRQRRIRFTESVPEVVEAATVIFLCVPTPTLPNGHADLAAVEDAARRVGEAMRSYRLVVEKSTVPVHTGRRVHRVLQRTVRRGVGFEVASNPEFLREGNAVQDALRPNRIVLGVESRRSELLLRRLYRPFRAPVIVTDVETAELIKHAANSFLATKISFINAVARICEAVGADVQQVALAMGLDPRIGPEFLQAGIGYGGSCLSKDVRAFHAMSRQVGYEFRLLREVERVNREAREEFLKKLERELWILRGKRAAVLGLAFKGGTDDVRDSVALEIVRGLVARGMSVAAYDPRANERARAAMGDLPVEYCRDAYAACRRADAILVLTDWEEFSRLNWARLRRIVQTPIVFDGRNRLDAERIRRAGFAYFGVGRPGEPRPGSRSAAH